MTRPRIISLLLLLAIAGVVAVGVSVVSSNADNDLDPEKEVDGEELSDRQQLALKTADRPIKGLDDLTKAHQVDSSFISLLEKHYKEYWDVEVQIFVDVEDARKKDGKDDGDGEDIFVPYPKEFHTTVLAADRFIKWCDRNDIDGASWIAQLLRVRGFVHVMSRRNSYDISEIQDEIMTVKADPNLSDKVKAEAVRRLESDLAVAEKMNATLDAHEPKWGHEELETLEKYWKALSPFLAWPKGSKFDKAEVDREHEAQKKREDAEEDNSDEGGED